MPFTAILKRIFNSSKYVFEILWNKAIPVEQKIREIEEGYIIEKIEVLFGSENVISAELRFFLMQRAESILAWTIRGHYWQLNEINKKIVCRG
jgi:hypothetical protein